jgi:hypothetical protein
MNNEYPTIKCVSCGKSMLQKRPWQKYCSQACKTKAFFKKHGSHPYLLSPQQKAWKTQHEMEKRLSNPEHYRARDERYRFNHYIYGGKTQYAYPKDLSLEFEYFNDIPPRAFRLIPEQYRNDVKRYFEEGEIMLDRIENRMRKHTPLKIHAPKDIREKYAYVGVPRRLRA